MSSSPASAVVSCNARDATSPREIAEPDPSWFSADEVPVQFFQRVRRLGPCDGHQNPTRRIQRRERSPPACGARGRLTAPLMAVADQTRVRRRAVSSYASCIAKTEASNGTGSSGVDGLRGSRIPRRRGQLVIYVLEDRTEFVDDHEAVPCTGELEVLESACSFTEN